MVDISVVFIFNKAEYENFDFLEKYRFNISQLLQQASFIKSEMNPSNSAPTSVPISNIATAADISSPLISCVSAINKGSHEVSPWYSNFKQKKMIAENEKNIGDYKNEYYGK